MAAKLLLVALSLTVFALSGCSGGGSAEIQIHDNTYDPSTLSVKSGTAITVTNHDSVPHTVTSDVAGTFNSGNVAGGAEGSLTAPSADGTYAFHCAIHPSMKGTLTVT